MDDYLLYQGLGPLLDPEHFMDPEGVYWVAMALAREEGREAATTEARYFYLNKLAAEGLLNPSWETILGQYR